MIPIAKWLPTYDRSWLCPHLIAAVGSLVESLDERGIILLVARLNRPGRETLQRSGVYESIGPDHSLPSVRTAVNSVTGEPDDETDLLIQRYWIDN